MPSSSKPKPATSEGAAVPDETKAPGAWVAMRNPLAPADEAAPTTRAAFDEVWQPKGWVEVDSHDNQDGLDLSKKG